jgi:hypothetical protein
MSYPFVSTPLLHRTHGSAASRCGFVSSFWTGLWTKREHHREVEMSDSWDEEEGCPRQYSGDIVSRFFWRQGLYTSSQTSRFLFHRTGIVRLYEREWQWFTEAKW